VDGTYVKVARITWSASDASVYVLPYVPAGGDRLRRSDENPGSGGHLPTVEAPRKSRWELDVVRAALRDSPDLAVFATATTTGRAMWTLLEA
jgi:hypothetical protein